MPPALSRTIAPWCGLVLTLAPLASAAESDPALVARSALAKLEQQKEYAWELRDLDGEIDQKTVWQDSPTKVDPWTGPEQRPRRTGKRIVTMLSPTVQGVYRADGWAVTEAGFADGPTATAVLHPSGSRVVRSGKGEWLTFGEFRNNYGPAPNRLTNRQEQTVYSSCWAAFTSPVPHVLLPKLLRDAENFRFEQDMIVAEISAASARLLLGQDGGARKLAPERFKGNARLRVRDGVLRECRLQLDYDVDLATSEDPSYENIDVLILFLPPSAEPTVVPEAARARLSDG